MSENKTIASLNELRGMAALTIVLSHIPIAKVFGLALGGYGVAIFYLLSGFLTGYVTKQGTVSFIKKRITKIVPLYWTVTLITFFVALALPNFFGSTEPTLGHLVKSLLFIPYRNTTTGLIRPILEVGWTLTLEMIFYGCFAIAMTISYRFRNYISIGLMLLFYATLGNVLSFEEYAIASYKYLIKYFIFGLCIAIVWPYITKAFDKISFPKLPIWLLTVLKIATLWAAAKAFGHYDWGDNYIWGIMPLCVVGTMALYMLYDRLGGTSKILTYMGAISFELYLTHEYVIKGIQRIIIPMEEISTKAVLAAILAIVIALALAALVHKIYVTICDRNITKFLTSGNN